MQINTACQGSCGAQRCHQSVFVPVSCAGLFLPALKPPVYSLHIQICKVNRSKIIRGQQRDKANASSKNQERARSPPGVFPAPSTPASDCVCEGERASEGLKSSEIEREMLSSFGANGKR